MTLIWRMFADKAVKISENPPHPLYPRSIYYLSKAKILIRTYKYNEYYCEVYIFSHNFNIRDYRLQR